MGGLKLGKKAGEIFHKRQLLCRPVIRMTLPPLSVLCAFPLPLPLSATLNSTRRHCPKLDLMVSLLASPLLAAYFAIAAACCMSFIASCIGTLGSLCCTLGPDYFLPSDSAPESATPRNQYCWMEHAFPSLCAGLAHSILLQSGRRFDFSG
jgi:hypothetical protein